MRDTIRPTRAECEDILSYEDEISNIHIKRFARAYLELLDRNAEARLALKLVSEECFTNLDCNHQEQDSGINPEECEGIDDCIGCTIVKICQAALAESGAIDEEHSPAAS